MGRRQFVPLELETIHDGRFLKQANSLLAEAYGNLIAYGRKHGSKAKGVKAKLCIEVSICCDNPDPESEAYSIKAQHKLSIPTVPVVAESGFASDKQDGSTTLLIPFTDNPVEELQGHLPLKDEKSPVDETDESDQT